MENHSLSASVIKHKWSLLLGAVGLVVLGIFLVLVSSLMIFQNPAETLPENTCPTGVQTVDGRLKALYQDKFVDMSLETYNWVKANCPVTEQSNVEKPILSNLGITFGKYNALNSKAGDFVLNKETIMSNWGNKKVFAEFGATLPSGIVSGEFGYYQLDIDTQVTAVAGGKVVEARYQSESDDFAFSVLYNDMWVVNYDHLKDLKFREGDMVKAGDVIGKVSPNKDGVTGFTEIGLKETDGRSPAVFHCPIGFLDPAVRANYEAQLKQLMSDWETVYGDATIYDESTQPLAGCMSLYFGE